jgi:hypothetical protein
MKKRTRLFLVVAVGVLVAGLGTGLVASYAGFQNFAIIGGNGPEELTYIPGDARMVAFADVRGLASSELRQKLRQFEPSTDQKHQFETQTGIDIERDVDSVLAAAWTSASAPQPPPLVLVRGRFDEVRIEGLIREHGGAVQDYKGKRLLIAETTPTTIAIAFLEPGLLAAGDGAAVRRAVDTKQAGTGSVVDNAELLKLIKDADNGNAWGVARLDAAAISPLPKEIAQQLPPINWISATGRVDSGVEAVVRAQAKDEQSAENLRDVVRGFIALARLQAGDKLQFAEVVNSLELGGEGTTVTLKFTVPATVIDALGTRAAQRRQASPAASTNPGGSLPLSPASPPA